MIILHDDILVVTGTFGEKNLTQVAGKIVYD